MVNSIITASKVRNGGVRHEAKRDAKEYARAKMFYGEGAGTRRKLINKSVEQKKKNDPNYASEFDKYLAKQDMAKHASAAKRERKAKDAKNSVAKTGRGVVNILTGHPERVGAGLLVAAAAYGAAHKAGIDKMILDYGKEKVGSVRQAAHDAQVRRDFENMMRNVH